MVGIEESKELQALERLYCSGNLNLPYVLSDKHMKDYNTVEAKLKKIEGLESKLDEVIDLLKKDGCNSKKQAINKLEEIKRGLENDK